MRSTLTRRFALVPTIAVLAASCGGPSDPAGAPVPAREVGAFVVRLGADTVALEEFTRGENRLEGRQLIRTPRTALREYTADLDADGTMRSFEMHVRDAPGADASAHARIDFQADSAIVRITRGGTEQTHRVAAAAGAIPFLGYSVALYELAFAALRSADSRTLELSMVPIGGSDAYPLRLERRGADSVIVRNIAGESSARVDAEGRLLSWDGRGSTLDLVAERAVTVDLDRYIQEYAARDAAGRGLGALSPRDSAVVRLGDTEVAVAYGRPSARGREIFGSVVPWGQVWRTGANQATLLRTERDLMIGETRVPAGTYSLFSIPSPTGWQLIVNRRSDQWGTDHDPAQDLARIPMQRESLAEPVERLTISFEPENNRRAVLRVAWDDTRASVPIRLP